MINKQIELIKVIKNFIESHGYAPTIRELCKIMGISSPATMHNRLYSLKRRGYIDFEPSKSRTIRVINEDIN